MAKPVSQITLGIDVAKDELVARDWANLDTLITVANDPKAIRAWLKSFVEPVRIALEPTSSYHMTCVEMAHALGIEVYLIGPRALAHYRDAVNVRNKTDPDDAYLLARYLAHEGDQLRPYKPRNKQEIMLWTLVKRRGFISQCLQQVRQSLTGIVVARSLYRAFATVLRAIDRQMLRLIGELGWQGHYQCCLSIPGIGPVNAAALTAAYHRGEFTGADAFIAYLGVDVRIRESGRFKGKRKLSKQGEAELRRLLYCAAIPARCHPRFADYHQRQLDKGLSKIAANIILARKLARLAFSLMRNQQSFSGNA